MKLVLPYPPPTNASPIGRQKKHAYEESVRTAVEGLEPMDGDLYLAARFYPQRGGLRGDLDNLLKTLFDSLKGLAYQDDRQVKGAYVKFQKPTNVPRVEVWITPWKEETLNAER